MSQNSKRINGVEHNIITEKETINLLGQMFLANAEINGDMTIHRESLIGGEKYVIMFRNDKDYKAIPLYVPNEIK